MLIKHIISNIIEAATIEVIWFGLSFVGIKQATSPPITFFPLRHWISFLASSILKPLKAGSRLAVPGATVTSRQSKSKVT